MAVPTAGRVYCNLGDVTNIAVTRGDVLRLHARHQLRDRGHGPGARRARRPDARPRSAVADPRRPRDPGRHRSRATPRSSRPPARRSPPAPRSSATSSAVRSSTTAPWRTRFASRAWSLAGTGTTIPGLVDGLRRELPLPIGAVTARRPDRCRRGRGRPPDALLRAGAGGVGRAPAEPDSTRRSDAASSLRCGPECSPTRSSARWRWCCWASSAWSWPATRSTSRRPSWRVSRPPRWRPSSARRSSPLTARSRHLPRRRTETVDSLAQSRFDWERVMRELALVIPEDVWLESLTGTVAPGVTVDAEGAGDDHDRSLGRRPLAADQRLRHRAGGGGRVRRVAQGHRRRHPRRPPAVGAGRPRERRGEHRRRRPGAHRGHDR